jgi:hypothetical protein
MASLGLLSALAFAAAPAQAQVNININTAPPVVVGAPADAQYYYIPEANAYYDVPARRYIVQRNGQWARYERLDGIIFIPSISTTVGRSPGPTTARGIPTACPRAKPRSCMAKAPASTTTEGLVQDMVRAEVPASHPSQPLP